MLADFASSRVHHSILTISTLYLCCVSEVITTCYSCFAKTLTSCCRSSTYSNFVVGQIIPILLFQTCNFSERTSFAYHDRSQCYSSTNKCTHPPQRTFSPVEERKNPPDPVPSVIFLHRRAILCIPPSPNSSNI
jgi:hypothetical protein